MKHWRDLPVSVALRDPAAVAHWSVRELEMLVRQARSANVLARLAMRLDELGLMARLPAAPRSHFEAARRIAQAQEEAVRREVAQIARALEIARTSAVLLKGAGYLFAGLPAARGRLFSDIDILVPRGALPQVEAALMQLGWMTTHHDAYDQRYYRKWMHELPPMQHVTRQSVLDVHHTIVPLTGRLHPDASKLLHAARPVPAQPLIRVLAPADMVLHSATHLFLNEEFSNGLRDLADLDSLLREFGAQPGFWRQLRERAAELRLERPLFYALRYTRALLDTPVEAPDLAGPGGARLRLMDALFLRALQPAHPTAGDRLTPLARFALYLRAHWMRMPPALLAYHLAVKAFRRPQTEPALQR